MKENPDINKIISYIALRRAVGILGIALPFVLVIGSVMISDCDKIQSSISLYYHTVMRNMLVGTLCGVALFMFSYRGYDIRDRIAGILTCIFALGAAFFPTIMEASEFIPGCNIKPLKSNALVSTIHFVSATLFFLALSYFSLFLFTRTTDKNKENYTPEKKKRNKIYRTCGCIMLACIFLIALWFFVIKKKYPEFDNYRPVFWLETIALFAFGISWLVKGEVIWKDKEKEIVKE